jgi:hypothetical protein
MEPKETFYHQRVMLPLDGPIALVILSYSNYDSYTVELSVRDRFAGSAGAVIKQLPDGDYAVGIVNFNQSVQPIQKSDLITTLKDKITRLSL